MTTLGWIEGMAALLTAAFAGLLWRVEHRRQVAIMLITCVQVIPHRKGRYKLRLVNTGWHDSALEEVRVDISLPDGSTSRRVAVLWIRRTARKVDDVRGLGLMVRSGEALWFTFSAPGDVTKVYVRPVLGKEIESGVTIGALGRMDSPADEEDAFEVDDG